MTLEQHNAFPRGRWSSSASPTIKTVECSFPYANGGKGETRLVTYESLASFNGFVCPKCSAPLWRIVGTSSIECLQCGVNATAKTIEDALLVLSDIVYDEQLAERRAGYRAY